LIGNLHEASTLAVSIFSLRAENEQAAIAQAAQVYGTSPGRLIAIRK
jgi:hypothetical protein